MTRLVSGLVAVLIASPVFAQVPNLRFVTAQAVFIDATRRMDWTHAGVSGGLPTRSTTCATLTASATAATINAAIAACPSGQVVQLAAGTYSLNDGLRFLSVSGITLRGAGADQTFLVFTSYATCHGYNADICLDSTDTSWVGGPSNTATWTAGYTKGTTSITLSAHTNLKVGAPLLLDQYDDPSDTGSKFVCQDQTLTPPCSLEGNGNNGYRNNRDQSQIVQVTGCGTTTAGASCTSNTMTVTPALYADNWSSGRSPGAWWATNPIAGVGIENLSLDNTGGSRGIEIFNGIDCWVSGIRSLNSNRSHVEIQNSTRVTVQHSYFYLTQDAVQQSYGVASYGSTDVLIQNNIAQYVTTPFQMNGCTGCVVAYNYTTNNYYEGSAGYMMPAIMFHSSGGDYTLVEGNIANQTQADVFHGTHNLITYFRNYFSGNQAVCYNGTPFMFGSCTNHLVPVELLSYSRLFNVIGNVLGASGVHTAYQNVAGDIYDLGSGNTESAITVLSDSLVASTLLRWGNWDVVTNATRWCGRAANTGWGTTCGSVSEVPTGLSQYANAVPSTETLPPSLYLSAAPAWWPGGTPFPPIGPDIVGGGVSGVGGHVYSLPARDCFLSTMGGPSDGTGAARSFNASSCYP